MSDDYDLAEFQNRQIARHDNAGLAWALLFIFTLIAVCGASLVWAGR